MFTTSVLRLVCLAGAVDSGAWLLLLVVVRHDRATVLSSTATPGGCWGALERWTKNRSYMSILVSSRRKGFEMSHS